MLTWLGFLEDKDIKKINEELRLKVKTKEINSSENFERINYPHENGIISIRPILFAPDKPEPRNNQVKFISGQRMIDFCWECFRPENSRKSCETNYWSLDAWGEQFEDLVRYFKQRAKTEQGTIKNLYEFFGIE